MRKLFSRFKLASKVDIHQCAIEACEPRRMLSGTAPQVVDVAVSSSQWAPAFISNLESHNLGTQGYSLPNGANQLKAVPWTNIDTIRIKFSKEVSVQASDLSVSGVNTTAYAFSNFTYDSSSHTAVWQLAAPITNDKILLDLSGDGLDPVQDSENNLLDGEWTNGSSSISGNGVAGGDFEFRINALIGDADGSGAISIGDYMLTRSLDGKTTQDSTYNPLRDIDGDGDIDSTDWMAVYSRVGNTLPTGNPAGQSNDAPTTAGIADVNVDEGTSTVSISLYDAFQDAETSDSQMTYQVVSNSNPSLFGSININTSTGQLELSLADEQVGEANLVVRATDAGGLFVDTQFQVAVNAVNEAPVLYDFWAESTGINLWTFHGKVSDANDDPTGWTVTFGGVLAGYSTTVQQDGTFTFVTQLDPQTFGNALAWTQDNHALESNTAAYFVGVT